MAIILDGTAGITTPSITNSGSTTLSGGTANGVAYLNGSKVLTTGSALTFDGSNLGLGVTPSAWTDFRVLNVGSNAFFGGAIAGNGTVAAVGANARYSNGWIYQTTAPATYYDQNNNAAPGAHRWFTAPSGTAGNAISFTQAMTLDASGNLLVGTTSATGKFCVVAASSQGSGYAGLFKNTWSGDVANFGVYITKYDNNSTTSQRFIGFAINNDGAGSGQINANGASQAAFGSFSDSRLKENVVELEPQLEKLMALRPVEFDYKDGSGHQTGFIAQEFQEVYPDAIGEADGYLTLTGYGKTEARLIKAIQELNAKLDAANARIEQLEAK